MSDTYPVSIAEVLAVPSEKDRWILIKKLLAADANQSSTRAIEFAYTLRSATEHLEHIALERTQHIHVREGFEPEDPADESSNSPRLMDFARKLARRRSPERDIAELVSPAGIRVPSRREREPLRVSIVEDEPVLEMAAESGGAAERSAAPDTPEVLVEAKGDSLPAGDAEEHMDRDVPQASQIATELAVDAMAEIVRDAPEVPIMTGEDDVEDEKVVDALGNESEQTLELQDDSVPEGFFGVRIDEVTGIEDGRARKALLKKLLAVVSNRRYTRSLPKWPGDNEVLATLRAHGDVIFVREGAEPIDVSDYGKRATSLEQFAREGVWSVPARPRPEPKPRRAPSPADGPSEAVEDVQEEIKVDPAVVEVVDEAVDETPEPEVTEALVDVGIDLEASLERRRVVLRVAERTVDFEDLLEKVRSSENGSDDLERLARLLDLEAARSRALAIVV